MNSDDEVLAAAMDAMYTTQTASRPHLSARRHNPVHPATFTYSPAPAAPPAANPLLVHSQTTPPPPTAAVNTENVKLQPFDINQPALWLRQAESIFRRKHITQQIDRYDILLAHLPTNVLVAVADIINTVEDDTADAYNRLKARLLSTYGKTDWELATALYDHPGLGDNKPSHLMNSLLSMLPPGESPGVLFLTLFMRRLPTYIRDQLATLPSRDPQQLALHADKIWTSHGGATAAINQLTAAAVVPTPSTSRPGTPGRRQSPSPRRTASPGRWCFYHKKFGDRAQRCQPPCSYRPKNYMAAGGN
jgi:hypothetical protein